MSKVAFLGPEATYTHQAALQSFGSNGDKVSLLPQVSIEDVFAVVHAGSVDTGVVPTENSSNGSVIFTLDLLADLDKRYPSIVIVGEVFLPVHHSLVGYKKNHQPQRDRNLTNGTGSSRHSSTEDDGNTNAANDISHITKLYSHPQAWGQCKAFLNSRLRNVQQQDVSSTSKGAEIVAAEGESTTSAAITSGLAARMNGLDVLVEGIEDFRGNTTRFFIIQRQSGELNVDSALTSAQSGPFDHDYKTMISFTVDHNSPAALTDALALFKKHDLSLTSINTRPSRQQRWMYIFFVEFWGRKDSKGSVDAALEDLRTITTSLRWLGSWKSALHDDA